MTIIKKIFLYKGLITIFILYTDNIQTMTPKERTAKWKMDFIATNGLEAWKEKQRNQKAKVRAKKSQKVQDVQDVKVENDCKEDKLEIEALKAEIMKLKANGIKKRKPLPPIPVDTRDDCEKLLDEIYEIKKKYLASLSPPKKIKKQSTIQQFARVMNIYKFMNGDDKSKCNNLDWLEDTSSILKFIDERYKTIASRNTHISSIASILFGLPRYNDEYMFYSNLATNNTKKIKEATGNNLLTAAEEKNMVNWSLIKQTFSSIKNIRDKALVALYVLIPPRRLDYGLMKVGNGDNINFNYYTSGTMIFNKYKTDKTYGKQVIKIPIELKTIIDSYISEYKLKDGDLLFSSKNGEPYKNFTPFINKVFKTYVGKNISVNVLRHSFISDYLKTTRSVNDMKNIANLMAHSSSEQKFYFRF